MLTQTFLFFRFFLSSSIWKWQLHEICNEKYLFKNPAETLPTFISQPALKSFLSSFFSLHSKLFPEVSRVQCSELDTVALSSETCQKVAFSWNSD